MFFFNFLNTTIFSSVSIRLKRIYEYFYKLLKSKIHYKNTELF